MSLFSIAIFILESDNLVDVEVEFDYEAELSDELSLKTGDIIENVKRMDGGWWEGSLNGKKGVFPDNFVKVRHIFFLIWVLTFSIILLQNSNLNLVGFLLKVDYVCGNYLVVIVLGTVIFFVLVLKSGVRI